MIALICLVTKKQISSKWLIYQRQKTKHFSCFYYTILFCCSNLIYFIMKIPNKQKLQQISFNHSSDTDFEEFMNLYFKTIFFFSSQYYFQIILLILEIFQREQASSTNIRKYHFGASFGHIFFKVSALLDVRHCPKLHFCAISRNTNDATLRKQQKP